MDVIIVMTYLMGGFGNDFLGTRINPTGYVATQNITFRASIHTCFFLQDTTVMPVDRTVDPDEIMWSGLVWKDQSEWTGVARQV
jgi:hypothetical protein